MHRLLLSFVFLLSSNLFALAQTEYAVRNTETLINPSASFTIQNPNACPGDTMFLLSTSSGASIFTWLINGAVADTGQSFAWIVPVVIVDTNIALGLIAADGISSDTSIQIVAVFGPPPPLGAPIGPDALCKGSGPHHYTLNTVPGYPTAYGWFSNPPNGLNVSGGGDTASVNVPSNYSGNVQLYAVATSQCYPAIVGQSLNIFVESLPPDNTPLYDIDYCQDPPNDTIYACQYPSTQVVWNVNPSNVGVLYPNSANNALVIDWDSAFFGYVIISALPTNSCGTGPLSYGWVEIFPDVQAPGELLGPSLVCKDTGQFVSTNYQVSVFLPWSIYTQWWLNPSNAGTIVHHTGTWITINWTPGYFGTASLDLEVVSSHWCGMESSSLSIDVCPRPPIPFVTRTDDTLFSSASIGNQWWDDTGPLPGETNSWYAPTAYGLYYVEVTNLNGCSSKSGGFWFSPFGINTHRSDAQIEVYPNPGKGEYRVLTDLNLDFFSIRDISGRVIMSEPFPPDKFISISHLSAGTYILDLRTVNGRSRTVRVIKY